MMFHVRVILYRVRSYGRSAFLIDLGCWLMKVGGRIAALGMRCVDKACSK